MELEQSISDNVVVHVHLKTYLAVVVGIRSQKIYCIDTFTDEGIGSWVLLLLSNPCLSRFRIPRPIHANALWQQQ